MSGCLVELLINNLVVKDWTEEFSGEHEFVLSGTEKRVLNSGDVIQVRVTPLDEDERVCIKPKSTLSVERLRHFG